MNLIVYGSYHISCLRYLRSAKDMLEILLSVNLPRPRYIAEMQPFISRTVCNWSPFIYGRSKYFPFHAMTLTEPSYLDIFDRQHACDYWHVSLAYDGQALWSRYKQPYSRTEIAALHLNISPKLCCQIMLGLPVRLLLTKATLIMSKRKTHDTYIIYIYNYPTHITVPGYSLKSITIISIWLAIRGLCQATKAIVMFIAWNISSSILKVSVYLFRFKE